MPARQHLGTSSVATRNSEADITASGLKSWVLGSHKQSTNVTQAAPCVARLTLMYISVMSSQSSKSFSSNPGRLAAVLRADECCYNSFWSIAQNLCAASHQRGYGQVFSF